MSAGNAAPPTVPLAHRELGGSGQPPLVLLHGLLGSSRNWQTVGRDLAARGHVFALDLRNHGASPHDAAMDWDTLVGDVLAWLDAQRFGAVSLLGHSLGGKIAMRLACRHPDRVKHLVVVDIAPKSYESRAHRAEFAAMAELDLATLESRAMAELRFEARVSDWGMRKFLTTNLERADTGQWRWTIPLQALTEALPVLESNSLEAGDRFEGSTVFVLGGRSRYVLESDHTTVRAHFPKARIETIAESGHNPHMDARESFVRTVLATL